MRRSASQVKTPMLLRPLTFIFKLQVLMKVLSILDALHVASVLGDVFMHNVKLILPGFVLGQQTLCMQF